MQTAMDINPYYNPVWDNSLQTPTTQQKPQLDKLPEKILDKIVEILVLNPTSDQDPTLLPHRTPHSLSLVSKTLNRLTEPHLYSSLPHTCSPKHFLSALYAQPYRFPFVKNLLLPPISSQIFCPDPYDYTANLRMLEYDRAISTLLLLCTQVETLHFTFCETFSGSQTARVVARINADNGQPLRKLKRVTWENCSGTCAPDWKLLFYFPHVEKVVFRSLDLASAMERARKEEEEVSSGNIRQDRFSRFRNFSVTNLRLSQCCLRDGAELLPLLSAFPALRSLDLTWDACTMDADKVSYALRICCPLLESLRIDTRAFGERACPTPTANSQNRSPCATAPEEDFLDSFGSLGEFRNLRYLALGPRALLEQGVPDCEMGVWESGDLANLPFNLQHLVILRHIPVTEVGADSWAREDGMVERLLWTERLRVIERVEVQEFDGTLRLVRRAGCER